MKGKTGEFQSCLMGASLSSSLKDWKGHGYEGSRLILIKSASFTETASTGGYTADEMCCLLWHRRAQRTVAKLRADSTALLWQTPQGWHGDSCGWDMAEQPPGTATFNPRYYQLTWIKLKLLHMISFWKFLICFFINHRGDFWNPSAWFLAHL